jgi:hypothetical protein
MSREIFIPNPNPAQQASDLLAGTLMRDDGGLPLGDVQSHALGRLTVCYGVLEAVRLAADVDRLPAAFTFEATGAAVQDRRGRRDYPAAHVVPCGLSVGSPAAGAPQALHDVFASGINRSFVSGLFGKTELVHRLTNYADLLCERTRTGDGMANSLVEGCTIVARDRRVSPREVLHEKLIPEFQVIAGRQIVDMAKTLPENEAPSRLVDQFGRPFYERPADYRIHSVSPQAYRANRRAVLQILSLYAGTHTPLTSALDRLVDQFKALRSNEIREADKRFGKR